MACVRKTERSHLAVSEHWIDWGLAMSQVGQSTQRSLVATVLRTPLVWGVLTSALFFGAVHGGLITNAFVLRYLAAHAIEHVLLTLFLTGMAAVVLRAIDVTQQRRALGRSWLPAIPDGGQPASDAAHLLARLAEAPASTKPGFMYQRLREALEMLRRKGSAAELTEDVRYLADLDASRAQHRNAFLLIVIWAIPILGLLGTVVGMTISIGNLSPNELETSIGLVTQGLGSAFDHTTLSLVLVMILMFSKFAADRLESRLLDEVDAATNAELIGRFQGELAAGSNPQLAPLARMAEQMISASDRLVQRQIELWQGTIEAAHEHWSQLSAATAEQMQNALGFALERSLQAHAVQLAAAEQAVSEQNRRNWSGVQTALTESSQAIATQQSELRQQGLVLLKVVEATGQVAALESTLNRNLESLAGSKYFEDTVISLSAAIQLLSTRLQASDSRAIDLGLKRAGHAA